MSSRVQTALLGALHIRVRPSNDPPGYIAEAFDENDWTFWKRHATSMEDVLGKIAYEAKIDHQVLLREFVR